MSPETTPAVPAAGTLPWLDRYTSTSGEIMTWVGITQSQLREFAAEWERRCWPILAEAVGGVETLRAEVARLEGERDEARADIASLAYWYCANCERRIPGGDVHWDEDTDAFCPYSSDQLEWCEPETLTSVKAYAAKLREGKNRAFVERDDLTDPVLRQRHKIQYLVTELARVKAERDQTRADLAALHAEAARLRAALDLAERDKAHAVVEQLRLMAERDEAKAAAARMRLARNEAQAERAALGPLVEAVLKFVEAEAQRSPAMENCSAWLEEQKVRRAVLLAAVDQMPPFGTPGTRQSDERGEVAGTDTVEAQEDTQGIEQCPEEGPYGRCSHPAGHEGNCHVVIELKRREVADV